MIILRCQLRNAGEIRCQFLYNTMHMHVSSALSMTDIILKYIFHY